MTGRNDRQASPAGFTTSAAPVTLRTARPADAPALAGLLLELGYPQPAAELGPRIAALADTATDAVLVADLGGRVVGMASLHVTPMFAEGQRRGRITALVVDPGRRRRSVGRLLLQAVEAAARSRGCVALELTSRPDRRAAHRFYLAAGYQDRPHRFFKQLDPAGDQHQGDEAPSTG
jgi:ribosomal protein S18 acetylase RimI-like enzyme